MKTRRHRPRRWTCSTEREKARAAKDFDRADELRDELAGDGLGGPRRGGRRSAGAAPVTVPRSRADLWPPPGCRGRARPAPRPSRLAGAGHAPGGARAALRLARPPGGGGGGGPLPLRRPGRPAREGGCPGRRPGPGAGPAQSRRGLPGGRGGRRVRGGDPGASRGIRDRQRRARPRPGAVEHLPVARVRNVADWLGEAKRAGAWVYGAAAEAERPLHRRRLDGAGRPGPRLGGLGAAAARRRTTCDELDLDPGRRPGRVAERVGGGRRDPLRGPAPARGRSAGLGRQLFGVLGLLGESDQLVEDLDVALAQLEVDQPAVVGERLVGVADGQVASRSPGRRSRRAPCGPRPATRRRRTSRCWRRRRRLACPRGRSRGAAGKPSRWRS